MVGHISNKQGELGGPLVMAVLDLAQELFSLSLLVVELSGELFDLSVVVSCLDLCILVSKFLNLASLSLGFLLEELKFST